MILWFSFFWLESQQEVINIQKFPKLNLHKSFAFSMMNDNKVKAMVVPSIGHIGNYIQIIHEGDPTEAKCQLGGT